MKKSRFGLIFSVLLLMAVMLTAVQPVSGEPSNTVRVWVTYQKGGKTAVLSALTRQDAEIHYDFPELDAYVVTLPEAALNGIWRNPFVLDIEADPVRYPIEPVKVEPKAFADTLDATGSQTIPWGIDAVQARDVWDSNKDAVIDTDAPTGAGIKVCIIDTGYYAGHEDLKDESTGYSQVDNDYLNDGGAHGSHVAGTVSALNNDLGVVGVSPGMVNLHIVKIFDNDGLWTSASNLVDAIYNCRDNGADVISMSLGGTFKNRTEEQAFDALYSEGILHIAAAGNDGNTRLSYPASYSSVISVAAIDSSEVVADFSQQNSAVELAAPGVGVLSTVPFKDQTTLTVGGIDYTAYRIDLSPTNISATGALADGGLCDSTGDWNGKVVLCERGVISFYEKVMNVQNSGGVAAVIYNNEPGDFLGTLGEGYTSEIPAASISQESGQDLVTQIGTSATLTNIYESPGSGYEAWDGTSMATPHVSGVAALIWSANPAWTNVEIREAMNATAKDLGATGRDNAYGYGLVQAADALAYLGGGTPVDNPPSLTITSPLEGATVSGMVAVTATASDDNGVTQVEFFMDNVSIGIDTNGGDGWSVSLDTTAETDGTHTLSATATDTAGQISSDTISVTVQNGTTTDTPPTVSISAPTAGSEVADVVTVTAAADDDFGVSQVEFFVDGASIGFDNDATGGWSITWDTTDYVDGEHSLSAAATDTADQTTMSESVIVILNNGGGTTYPIELSASAYKVRGAGVVDLSWIGSTATFIDIYRNGGLLVTVPDEGSYTDNDLGKGGGSATYQVCEAGTDICSNEVTAIW
jgi:subtilisin family serine protease